MKHKAKKNLTESGLLQLAIQFSAPALFQGYNFFLNDYIKIYNIHVVYTCNIQFLDIIGAQETNSIFSSVTSTGGTGLTINDPNNTAYYLMNGGLQFKFDIPLIVKGFRITKATSGVSVYFYYQNYSAL